MLNKGSFWQLVKPLPNNGWALLSGVRLIMVIQAKKRGLKKFNITSLITSSLILQLLHLNGSTEFATSAKILFY